ncbi:MAG: tetraacyldisaccharide 4'-kinase [Gemmatimonadota bacterium]|nr:tetraacyldisaccharide 4'-kinase [Gemmatimonadota bacterium]
MDRRFTAAVERSWRAGGVLPVLLAPMAWLYRGGVAVRNALFDRGLLTSHPLGLPTISVGNLTVGGTGKTPMSAWMAQEMLRRGIRPAILLRGYGDDEPAVHRTLTPEAVVIADADRVRGATAARAAGAQVIILDDGFQHRRAARDLDLVLVAAEQGVPTRLLPAGPLREPQRAMARASLLIVTRKSASVAQATEVAEAWSHFTRRAPVVLVSLVLDAVCPMASSMAEPLPLRALSGQRVLAIAGIGDPAAFARQIEGAGARVDLAAFPDHAPFSEADLTALSTRAREADRVVCTLKDAVKLGDRWPRNAPPLWYLSQRVVIERGGEGLAALLDRAVATRDG